MSIYLYDKALQEKLQRWTANTNATVLSPDDTERLFEVQADTSNDKAITLPLICLKRNAGYIVNQKNRQPLSYSGYKLRATYERSMQLSAISVTIPYQIDIYTRYFREADEYARNFVFNIINYPTVSINIPYEGLDREHKSALVLSSDVQDTSGIPERLVLGQFTRLTIEVTIPDAYLWDVHYEDNIHIVDKGNIITPTRPAEPPYTDIPPHKVVEGASGLVIKAEGERDIIEPLDIFVKK